MTPTELAERGLRVKPLPAWWSNDPTLEWHSADYTCRNPSGMTGWWVFTGGPNMEDRDYIADVHGIDIMFPALEAAKAAAEADHASRIAAQLEGMG